MNTIDPHIRHSSDSSDAFANLTSDEFDNHASENNEKLVCLLNRDDASVLIHPLMEEGFGTFVAVNDTALKQYGYSREEFFGLTAADLTNPLDSVRHASRSNRKILKDKRHILTRSEHITKAGRVIPVEIDATVLPHQGRDLILAVVRDLSDRHETERALLESEIKFRSILEKSADPVYLASVDGRLLDVNEAAIEVMGYSRSEILEMYISDLDPVSERFNFEDQWDQVSKEGRLRIETVHRKKDGTVFPVEVHIAAFLDHGQKTLLGTARDISERKEQERKLTESEYRFRALLESVKSLAVQGYQGDGTIFFWNPANELIYGYSAEEAIGKNLVDLIIPDEMKDGVRAAIEEAGKTGKMPKPGELYLLRKDGERVWVYSSHVAVRIGDHYELYCLDVDMSPIKEAERQKEFIMHDLFQAKELAEQANKAKDDFLAVMSHEMRTPLNPIVGYASLMLDDCREDQRDYLQSILNSSNRMLNLVEDILDFARFERGDQRLKPTRNVLIDMCNLALTDVRDLGSHLKLIFENGFDEYFPIPLTLEAEYDYHGLLRILDNLLTNACKYTKDGEVRLKIGSSGRICENGNAGFVFHVCDSGIGIAEDHLEKLFEPFHQVDSSYTRSNGGVGLGLAVCKKLVALMGGTISVKSEPGTGSCFMVELSLPVHFDECHLQSIDPSKTETRLPEALNILLVEDEEDNLRMTQAIIERWGGKCHVVNNGRQAVELCRENSFEMILMDLGMPDIDGFETTRLIRNLDNANSQAKMIAITADTGGDVQERCRLAGLDGYLAKPFNTEALLEIIRKFST